MNALATIDLPAVSCWDEVYKDVNAWRGTCMHHFTQVEMAVTQTLIALSAVNRDGETLRLRHLIGQQYEDLASAISPAGPFAKEGKAAFALLSGYRDQHEAFRALLCHGTIKVALERNGQWLLMVRSLSIRSRQAVYGEQIIEQSAALERLAALKRDGQKLSTSLGNLRKSIE